MGGSKNRGTQEWMVYNGKPLLNGWFGGTPIFGTTHMMENDTQKTHKNAHPDAGLKHPVEQSKR